MPTVRLNTQTAYVPFLSSDIGQNIIYADEGDKKFVVRAKYVGTPQQDLDIGIPTPTYIENVIPTIHGWQSVGFRNKVKSLEGAKFNQLIPLKSGTETNLLYSPAQGKNYISYQNRWDVGFSPSMFAGMVTHAYTKLRSLIFYQRQWLLEYDFALKTFEQRQFDGLDPFNIDGILAANNYLIAWNETTIFWSSTLDPLDFKPSLSSGAGSQNPTQVRGKIIGCLPISDGFIIYTTANAISAKWSGNIRYPWKFEEIPGSAGIRNIEHVTYDANYDGHFAWTISGLQLITPAKSEMIFSEITDFITRKIVEEYIGPRSYRDFINRGKNQEYSVPLLGPNVLQQLVLKEEPWVKLTLIASRYLLFSYGYRIGGNYDYVIFYDLSLQRYGKLKIRHVDAFEYIAQQGEQIETKNSIGFLQEDGSIYILDTSQESTKQGILLYGSIQLTSDAFIDLETIKANTVGWGTPDVGIVSSEFGSDFDRVTFPWKAVDTPKSKEWYCRVSAKAVHLLFSGDFNLATLSVEFNIGGSR